jgi:hypothetical protein
MDDHDAVIPPQLVQQWLEAHHHNIQQMLTLLQKYKCHCGTCVATSAFYLWQEFVTRQQLRDTERLIVASKFLVELEKEGM